LPLQKAARKNNNSVFIDEQFLPFPDQWEYLASIKRISETDLERFIAELCQGNELGTLKEEDEEETAKPWHKMREVKLSKNDFPSKVEIVKANMLFITKTGFTQRAMNRLKRLAAFKNPEFYKAQAMRLPTFNKPRIISCSEESPGFLGLPRGCENDLKAMMDEYGIEVCLIDETNPGKNIDVEFTGKLRDEQSLAVKKMLEHESGILCGTTAFGKTVAAIKLIDERQVNTLIIVDKINLQAQWKERLSTFLKINETIDNKDVLKNTNQSVIGEIGGGKKKLSGIIDIAVMQSLNRMGEIKDCVKNYGMVIVDECHHVSAFNFETILKNVNAKYVYGLTATPLRKDGHHPIIFMQCGPIRYRDDALKQAEARPFEHFIVPKFTSFRLLSDIDSAQTPIFELYSEITENKIRNQLIIDNVIQCHRNGRNCIVLTERTIHVKLLAEGLGEIIPEVIAVHGGLGSKKTGEIMAQIKNAPSHIPITIVATGKYIGEGFDEPRLDTLFLAMPISWKGTLQQYAGRLHRLYEGKKDVRIYDFVDIHVKMFEKMYHKRLNGYASIGYKVIAEDITTANVIDIIYNKSNFLPVFSNDTISASREVFIVSPFLTKRRTREMIQFFRAAIAKSVKIIVVTRPAEDYKGLDLDAWQASVAALKELAVQVVYKSNIHQKLAIMDQKIVWYGSINLLSYGSAEESMMRIDNVNIAGELIKSIE
jgi:superfamily II DNA or RNA helicase